MAVLAFRDYPLLMGSAALALRHAFDADHIPAIDNVVRKLMHEGQRPIAAGTFFAVGHSTVVTAASAAIVLGVAVLGPVGGFSTYGGIVGGIVSTLFLLAIAAANMAVFAGNWRLFRHMRAGDALSERERSALLHTYGAISRLFGPLLKVVRRSWHLFPLGVLFPRHYLRRA